jgi:hypothetical protein
MSQKPVDMIVGSGEFDSIGSRLHQARDSGMELNFLRYDQDAFRTLLQEFMGTPLQNGG